MSRTFLAVDCGGLSSPMNGSLSGNLTVYPNIVTFSCDPGFILHGSSVRKCQSNGTWDGYKTACEGIMHKIPNGHVQVLLNVLRTTSNGSLVGNLTTYPHKVQFRGGSRIFFRRGCTRLLLYFNTNKPHSFL